MAIIKHRYQESRDTSGSRGFPYSQVKVRIGERRACPPHSADGVLNEKGPIKGEKPIWAEKRGGEADNCTGKGFFLSRGKLLRIVPLDNEDGEGALGGAGRKRQHTM